MVNYSKWLAMHKSIILWIWLLAACPAGLRAAEVLPLALQLKVLGLRQAGPPEIQDGRLILTYQSDRPVRLVAARFAHEEYRALHRYSRTEKGIFVLVYDLDRLPEGLREVRYRIEVDGLWMADPLNPRQEADAFGTAFSIAAIEKRAEKASLNPAIEADGTVSLRLAAAPGKRVTVSGTFNCWDPFLHPLTETRPGLYQIRLRLLPGRYSYHFWVDGVRLPDPGNRKAGLDEEGLRISTFDVPEPDRAARAGLDYLDLRLSTLRSAD